MAVPFYFYVFIQPPNLMKGSYNYGKSVLIDLITYEENCFNVAFIFLAFRENI